MSFTLWCKNCLRLHDLIYGKGAAKKSILYVYLKPVENHYGIQIW